MTSAEITGYPEHCLWSAMSGVISDPVHVTLTSKQYTARRTLEQALHAPCRNANRRRLTATPFFCGKDAAPYVQPRTGDRLHLTNAWPRGLWYNLVFVAQFFLCGWVF